MEMFNPPHPGAFIAQTYLQALNVSARVLASHLDVSPSTLSRVLQAKSAVSPDMALRLSLVLGRSPESWLAMQDQYDLWQARQHSRLDKLKPLVVKTEPTATQVAA